jgi:hypothetical protein
MAVSLSADKHVRHFEFSGRNADSPQSGLGATRFVAQLPACDLSLDPDVVVVLYDARPKLPSALAPNVRTFTTTNDTLLFLFPETMHLQREIERQIRLKTGN